MISFDALIYDATNSEYLNGGQPRTLSFAVYTGDTNVLIAAGDGSTVTTIPLTDYDFSYATNICCVIEAYARQIHNETNIWPVIKVCTTRSTDDYYLEWSHSDPSALILSVNGNITTLSNAMTWYDNVEEGQFNYPCLFTTAATIDGLSGDSIVFYGSFDTHGQDVVTNIGYATYIMTIPSAYYAYEANALLATYAGGGTIVKSYKGPAFVFGVVDLDGFNGIVTLVPLNTSTNQQLYPYDGRFQPGAQEVSPNVANIVHYQNVSIFGRRGSQRPGEAITSSYPVYNASGMSIDQLGQAVLDEAGVVISYSKTQLYEYLLGAIEPVEPPSDVDPVNPPDPDDPIQPIPPDNQDPYYDPTSDPKDPTYDPTKDPKDPTYDPTTPHTPYRPPSDVDGGGPAPVQPIPGIIDIPTAPPAFVTNNSLFTLYNPSGGDLNNLANFLWSPTWSIDTLKKIFVNPMDCILGLMVMPQLPADVSSKEMNFGNVPTGITMHFFTKQFCDFDCGTFKLEEFYMSYLDYAPYTKVSIFLPYIGEVELSTDEVMNKTIGVKYRFDISCGACVAFISVDGSTLYSFSGNCAAHLPLSANDWGSTVTALAAVPLGAAKIGAMIGGGPIGALGAAAAISVMSMKEKVTHAGTLKGSAGLMGIQTPYLIVNRPRQAAPLNQNSFTGYPSFITESLGSLHGYTEVEQCHLDHVPATHEELVEIERLLKEGVML